MTITSTALAPAAPTASLLGVYRPAAPTFVAGSGPWLTDDTGARYLDFTSGIAVNALGHGSRVIAAAVESALATGLVHTSNLFRTTPAAALADWLVAHSFADAVFFANSGAEANEAAIKFARRWARETGDETKTEIVALRGGFHGRTLGALSVTDRADYQAPFAPLVPGIRFVDPWAGADPLAGLDPARTAAVMAEPLQAEGGVRPLPRGFLARLRAWCDAAGALLVLDEVQVGLGRTGTLWAHEADGVVPDIMTLAKPLAGGLPMGATLVTADVAAAIRPGDHGSTFGGGPLVASVALAVCRAIADPAFLAGVRERAAVLDERLTAIARRPEVVEVRGRGLIRGLQLRPPAPGSAPGSGSAPAPAAALVARALEHGLLLCAAGPDTVRLLPPLNIPEAELHDGLDRLEAAL